VGHTGLFGTGAVVCDFRLDDVDASLLSVVYAFALFFLYVAFELNGTSLYRWSVYFGGAEEYRPLFGTARAVRGDEWAAWSAFTMSQEYAGWPAVNRLIADGDISTVWISVGGIPAFNPAVIFKPLYWGFLLLGTDKGISILWVLRFILLFFVSFEFARVYTGNNRKLSFAAAMMITLAPYVQWWFSQSIAEVFIFGQGMLLCLHFYLGSDKRGSRMAAAAMLAYCLGCYVMIGYPSWLISTLYVLIPAAGVMIAQNRSCLGKKDILAYQASKRGGYLYCEPKGDGRISLSGKAALVAVSEIIAEL